MFNKKGFGINFKGSGKQPTNKEIKNAALPPKVPDIEYQGDETYEGDRQQEIEHVLTEFQKSAQRETERRDDYIDDKFYSCVVFSNAAQRNAFFSALGVNVPENATMRFINGIELAKIMGIQLPESSPPPPERFKVSKQIMALTHLPRPKK